MTCRVVHLVFSRTLTQVCGGVSRRQTGLSAITWRPGEHCAPVVIRTYCTSILTIERGDTLAATNIKSMTSCYFQF